MFKIKVNKPKKKPQTRLFVFLLFFNIHPHSKDNHLQTDNLAKFQV